MDKKTQTIVAQSALFGTGAAIGAGTHKALTATSGGHIPVTMQVASAMGAAAAGGAGVSGTLAAGTAVVAAKVAVVTAAATVAAPFVIGAALVGGAGYGIYKIFKKL